MRRAGAEPTIVDGMRLPASVHTEQPWRIHEIAPDFEVLDVWRYRTPGAGPDDFPTVIEVLDAQGRAENAGLLVRFLFAVRWKLGAVLGWDQADGGVGARVRSLRERLPADIPPAPAAEQDPSSPFARVYELHNELADEVANKTVHGIAHLGWVPSDGGEYELRMAVLVKPNGRLGRVYLAAIWPFRHLIVYPAMSRMWERAWRNRATGGEKAVSA